MAKKRQMDIKAEVKELCLKDLQNGLDMSEVHQTDTGTYAIPYYVDDGEGNELEICAEVKITTKNWYNTSKTKAYDLQQAEQDYADIVAKREADAKERAEKKAKKIAKKKESEEKGE